MKILRSSVDGFTLLEVMIAMAIIATALVTLLSLAQRSITLHDKVQHLTRATMLAQQLMNEEEIQGTSGDSSEREDVFEEPFDDFSWRISYQDTMISQVRQVTVTVIWGEEQRNDGVSLVSFIPVSEAQ